MPLHCGNVSKCGVISGPYFPVFNQNTGKCGPEITTYLDTFHAVLITKKWLPNLPKWSFICLFSLRLYVTGVYT